MYEINDKVTAWINNPLDNGMDSSLEKADQFIEEINQSLTSYPDSRSSLGPLLGKVKAVQKKIKNIELVEWEMLGSGALAIGHRPSVKMMNDLKLQGVTHILTLLTEKEGATELKKLSTKEGLKWLWYPMDSAKPPDSDELEPIIDLFKDIKEALNDNAKLYLHCSAGIHRTGMITYAFLRFSGMQAKEARDFLKKLRLETGTNVGEDRVNWGDQFST